MKAFLNNKPISFQELKDKMYQHQSGKIYDADYIKFWQSVSLQVADKEQVSLEDVSLLKEKEAAGYNTTRASLERQGFIFDYYVYGRCHWFANTEYGTLMSLEWFREQGRKTIERWRKAKAERAKNNSI